MKKLILFLFLFVSIGLAQTPQPTQLKYGAKMDSAQKLNTGGAAGIIQPITDKGGQVFNVQAFGAVGSGSVNDAAHIQAAINALPATGGTILLPTGTYRLDATLTVGSNVKLKADVMGATIRAKDALNAPLITLTTGSNNVSIEGISIDGNRTTQVVGNTTFGAYGVYGLNISNLTIRNVAFKDTRNFGIYLRGVADTANNTNIEIASCTFDSCGSNGMLLRRAFNVNIHDCRFSNWGVDDNTTNAIGLWDSAAHVTITHNLFQATISDLFAVEVGMQTYGADISDNEFSGANCGVSGYWLYSRISRNHFADGSGTNRSGIEVVGSHNIISENVIDHGQILCYSTTTPHGDSVACQFNIVTNNRISNHAVNAQAINFGGLHNIPTSDNTIKGNLIDVSGASGSYAAIWIGFAGSVYKTNRITVSDNDIQGNNTGAGVGIRFDGLSGSSDFLFMGNRIRGVNEGFSIDDTCTEMTVALNDLRGCSYGFNPHTTSGVFRVWGNITATNQTSFPIGNGLTLDSNFVTSSGHFTGGLVVDGPMSDISPNGVKIGMGGTVEALTSDLILTTLGTNKSVILNANGGGAITTNAVINEVLAAPGNLVNTMLATGAVGIQYTRTGSPNKTWEVGHGSGGVGGDFGFSYNSGSIVPLILRTAGGAEVYGSIKSGAPSGGTSGYWKFGIKNGSTVQLDVDGVLYHLADSASIGSMAWGDSTKYHGSASINQIGPIVLMGGSDSAATRAYARSVLAGGGFGSMAYADSAKYHGSASITTVGTLTNGIINWGGAITTTDNVTANGIEIGLSGTAKATANDLTLTTDKTNGSVILNSNGTGYITTNARINQVLAAAGNMINTMTASGAVGIQYTRTGSPDKTWEVGHGSGGTGNGFGIIYNTGSVNALTFTTGGDATFAATVSATGGNSTNWNTAYSQTRQWDGGSTGLVAATGRTSLGIGDLGAKTAFSPAQYIYNSNKTDSTQVYTRTWNNNGTTVHLLVTD